MSKINSLKIVNKSILKKILVFLFILLNNTNLILSNITIEDFKNLSVSNVLFINNLLNKTSTYINEELIKKKILYIKNNELYFIVYNNTVTDALNENNTILLSKFNLFTIFSLNTSDIIEYTFTENDLSFDTLNKFENFKNSLKVSIKLLLEYLYSLK